MFIHPLIFIKKQINIRIIFIFIFISLIFSQKITFGQEPDTLTLNQCYDLARESYPLAKQIGLLDANMEKRIENLKTNYYPQLNFLGQASYQSAVTYVEISIPENPYFSGEDLAPPPIDKDWYKFQIDINQMIYDGGTTAKQKEIEYVNNQIDRQSVEIELYGLRERVNDVFFGIVLLQEKAKLQDLVEKEISSKLQTIESAVRNGTMLESNADILKAELIKLEQQQIEVRIGIESGFNILEELLSYELSGNELLNLPELVIQTESFNYLRPEFDLMTMQQAKLKKLDDVLATGRRPRLMGYGQVGYGRPALDMLNNNFDTYAIVGARLTWNIWDWNVTRNERQILLIQSDIIGAQKETFEKNLKVGAESSRSEITKYEQILARDDEIIVLRKRIKNTASSQLDNGVITSTDFVTELNAEQEALLNKEIHRIQLVKAKVDWLTVLGKL